MQPPEELLSQPSRANPVLKSTGMGTTWQSYHCPVLSAGYGELQNVGLCYILQHEEKFTFCTNTPRVHHRAKLVATDRQAQDRQYSDGLQHKGTMSTKPVFEKITKIQKSYVPLCGHTTFVLSTPARTMTIIDKITIYSNDVNKTSTSVELLATNILRHVKKKQRRPRN